jgi:hypothetical protein
VGHGVGIALAKQRQIGFTCLADRQHQTTADHRRAPEDSPGRQNARQEGEAVRGEGIDADGTTGPND